jgi:CRP/FNR family transcriptional regulator, cyclic AMP receptor protein
VISAKASSAQICHVLHEDPDLAEALPAADRQQAIEDCIAPVIHLVRGRHPGEWSRQWDAATLHGGIGLLVLDGLMLRRVGVDGRFGAELIGDGDLLRAPQRSREGQTTLPSTMEWRILEPTRLALLDREAAQRVARYPDLIGRLVGRVTERTRNATINMAIVHQARVDVRLHMLFWHLADRWGRVRGDVIVLPLRLTHAVLADLVAAQRPTVSSALSDLAKHGYVRFVDDAWILPRHPPGELEELRTDPPHGKGMLGGGDAQRPVVSELRRR